MPYDYDPANPNHVDVSAQFKQLTILNFFISTMMWLTAFYQVVALAGYKELIKYRFLVSRLDKVVLTCFVFLIGLMFVRRLSPAAKFCSGDHFTYEEWRHKFVP